MPSGGQIHDCEWQDPLLNCIRQGPRWTVHLRTMCPPGSPRLKIRRNFPLDHNQYLHEWRNQYSQHGSQEMHAILAPLQVDTVASYQTRSHPYLTAKGQNVVSAAP